MSCAIPPQLSYFFCSKTDMCYIKHCNENRVFSVKFFSQGKPCFHYRDLCNDCLMTAWWLPNDCPTNPQWLSDGCLITDWWLSNNCLVTARWRPDDYQMTARWLTDDCPMAAWQTPDDCLTTAWRPHSLMTVPCKHLINALIISEWISGDFAMTD